MFSGIIQNKQLITDVKSENGIVRVKIQRPEEFEIIQRGESIAVDGVCLTVEDFNATQIQFAYAFESIQLLKIQADQLLGRTVNLERSLSLNSPIHGHLVSGHVEALGSLLARRSELDSLLLDISIPNCLQKYVWEKGGITINGVALTVNKISSSPIQGEFAVSVCIIPETLQRTNLGQITETQWLNIESDYFLKAFLNRKPEIQSQDFERISTPHFTSLSQWFEPAKALKEESFAFSSHLHSKFSPVDELVEDIRSGKMVILVDDEDRENEGDLVLAASLVTAEKINFMAKEARGLICLSLTPQQCDQLKLPMMVSETNNQTPHKTAFTVSIEAAHGISTGISANDRAQTILVAANPTAKPIDIIMPGHIFPLRAKSGGVLERQGHTEGSIDLVKLAGLPAAAVICEVINDDGTMARVPDLHKFAFKHRLKMGTIKDLVVFQRSLLNKNGINNEKKPQRSDHEAVR